MHHFDHTTTQPIYPLLVHNTITRSYTHYATIPTAHAPPLLSLHPPMQLLDRTTRPCTTFTEHHPPIHPLCQNTKGLYERWVFWCRGSMGRLMLWYRATTTPIVHAVTITHYKLTITARVNIINSYTTPPTHGSARPQDHPPINYFYNNTAHVPLTV